MKFKDYITEEKGEWYDEIDNKVDEKTKALIDLFSSTKKIKDHKDFHTLAEKIGIKNPSDLEEVAYGLLQSFFSQGRYMKEGKNLKWDKKELEMGIEVEMEHTDNPLFACRIALDHLCESKNYYSLLAEMEKKGEKPDK